MFSSTNSFSDIILTRPHIQPTALKTPTPAPNSRNIPNALIQYAPLSTSSSSTLLDYAPLSSTTSPAFTSRPTSLTACIGLKSSSSQTADADQSAHPGSQAAESPVWFTVVILVLLGLLLALATMMWFAESKRYPTSHNPEHEERRRRSEPRTNVEPIGLGIILQPAIEDREETGGCKRLKGWLATVVERGKPASTIGGWTNFVVSKVRAELGMDAEEGLLLPIRESERIGSEKSQTEFELSFDHEY